MEVSVVGELMVGLEGTVLSSEELAVVVCFECSLAHVVDVGWQRIQREKNTQIVLKGGWENGRTQKNFSLTK